MRCVLFGSLLLLLVATSALASGPPVRCDEPLSKQESASATRPKKKAGRPPLGPSEIRKWGPIGITAVIDCKGRMVKIQLPERLPSKVRDKLRANLQRWRFRPARLEGKDIAVRLNLVLRDRTLQQETKKTRGR